VKPRIPQLELPGSAEVFNLAGEVGEDPLRLVMERGRQATALEARRRYEHRMQRILAECPGFAGAEAPGSDSSEGKVSVQPAWALEARAWLHRRFYVCDDLELSSHSGLVFMIKPRPRKRSGRKLGPQRSFWKPEQFQFAF
jgi:hypothetical protein